MFNYRGVPFWVVVVLLLDYHVYVCVSFKAPPHTITFRKEK